LLAGSSGSPAPIWTEEAAMRIKVQAVAYHRNGMCGEGFHVVTFKWCRRDMVGVVFDGRGRVAVLDTAETSKGNIAMGAGNSWRADDFELELRAAVRKYEQGRRQTIALSEEQKRLAPSDIRD